MPSGGNLPKSARAKGLEEKLDKVIQDIEKSAENNIKFVNLLQENARSQNDNMNYLEKKLEFIDKTIELKTKHFDEVIKDSLENNDDLVKMVQASLHAQTNLLNSIERNINSIKYWLVLTIVAVGGLVWGTSSHFHNMRQQGRASISMGELTPAALNNVQEENRRLITKIQEDNKAILAVIQKDNKKFFSEQGKLNALKAKAVKEDTKKFIAEMQRDNRELLTAVQRTNQEYLTTIIHTLRSEQPVSLLEPEESSTSPQKATRETASEEEPGEEAIQE